MRRVAIILFCVACDDGGAWDVTMTFDRDGFADELVEISSSARFAPTGIKTGDDGAIFVHGHADIGDGMDASTNGRNVIIKLGSDGRPDAMFGDGGVFLQLDMRDGWTDLAVRPDGRLVVAGWLGGRAALWQVDATGVADSSFGAGGVVVLDVAGAGAIALEADGAAILAGEGAIGETPFSFSARVSVAGVVEVLTIHDEAPTDRWHGVLIDDGGRPIVFGERTAPTGSVPIVARLTPTLEVDETSLRVGAVTSYCRAPVALPGGGFAATGSADVGAAFSSAVLVFTDAGELDASFDGDGHLPLDAGWAFGVASLPGGDFLAQLQDLNATPTLAEYVVQISPDGVIDPAFGDAGRSTGAAGASAFGLVSTPDGHAYAASWVWPDGVLVRRVVVP